MNKKISAALLAIPFAMSSLSTAMAQDEEESPYVVPVDTFTCSYNDGMGPADFVKAADNWNAWADERGVDNYGAMIITPYYFGADTFDVGWLGYWTNQEAMGVGIDAYLAEGGEAAEGFAKAVTCDTHSHFASIQVKSPPEGEMPDNVVLMFSNCTKSDDVEWDALFEKINAAVAYQEEKGFKKGDFMMWPVFGGEGKPDWDFKWVTSFANYTDFGIAYQHNANGGGRQAMNEIMGEALDCDTARVYNAKVVRKVTAEMDE
jgi:hypothetical protein